MPEVIFLGHNIVELGPAQLAGLKREAAHACLRRARLCLHLDHSDQIQEMVIAFCRDSYVRPHRHAGKSESFHVIEGELVVVIFDDAGQVTRRIEMGPIASGKTFLYRLSSNAWHSMVPRSDFVIVHETTGGPFTKAEQQFAPWAPSELDLDGISALMRRIRTWPCHEPSTGVSAP